jgi:serine/threonine-protein kinase
VKRPGPHTGRTLGNYLLGEVLDEGGVGSVYVAEHRFLGEKAAVKVLQQQPLQSDPGELARRFFQEARATRSIDHPNVIKVHDFGRTDDGILYLAMELLEGLSIADVLRRSPIEERSAAFIAAAVASGLHAAHERGIIHRDLKPGNIFLCASGRVRLLDFGMAKLTEGPLRTGVGMIVGTPQYMSPEQIRQEKIGPRADVYGLGAVLYRMLTGKLPFQSESLHEIVKMHLNSPPPRPSEAAKCSTMMDEIVLACLQKDPAKRPGSMIELRELLRPIAEQLGPGAAAGIAGQDRGEMVPRPETAEGLKALARSVSQPRPSEPSSNSTMTPARNAGPRVLALLLVAAAVAGVAVLKPWTRFTAQVAPTHAAPIAPVAPPPAPTMPTAEFSITNVQSDPPGAQVFVDHVQRGVAPVDLTVALPFELKLEMSGYKTVRKKITKPGPVKIKLWPESHLPAPPPGASDPPGEKLPPD